MSQRKLSRINRSPLSTRVVGTVGFSAVAGPLLLGSLGFAQTALAQSVEVANGMLEEVLITGSRRMAGSITDVPVPVDLINADQLSQQGSTDMSDMLATSIPSLNVGAHPISGTSSGMRPPTLRGLSPDHTLVLLNGKRRHRGAEIPSFTGGITDGSQGPDLSSIPAIALKQVQVLRDGAAAQYGSDAIAGVINFILDDSTEGGRLEVKAGETYEGDGGSYTVAGTYGISLGNSGFLRLSGEYRESDLTVRAVQRGDALALQEEGNSAVPDPATRFGTPETEDDIKLAINMGVDAGSNAEFYGFGTYAARDTSNDLFYRYPKGRFGVFTDNDDGGNYLVGDMTPEDGMNCDGGIDFGGTGVVNNPIAVGSPDAAERLAGVFADPNCYSFLQKWPGGYTPFIEAQITDAAGVLGFRGELDSGLVYDVSGGVGYSEITWAMENVPNPSMGSFSPDRFSDIGAREQLEKSFNIDLSYPLEIDALASPLNVAGGFEWREEQFTIVAGEPASYEAGVLANQGFLIGEEAIPGLSPRIAGEFDRDNIALYLDLEADVIDWWVLGAAVRYEDFSDFGSETTFKISSLFRLTDSTSLRGSIATGFHAPTPGQQNFSNVTTEIGPNGSLIESGIIPPSSPVAQKVGASDLEPETSDSFTVGLVHDGNWFTLTLDYYSIDMEDRLTQSASYQLTPQEIQELVDAGFPGASGLGSFRFFTNDFDSETTGLDLVLSVPVNFGHGTSKFDLLANWTDTEVTSYDPNDPDELLSAGRVIQLEENNPEYRGNLTFTHEEDIWRMMVRVNYFGSYTELHVNSPGLRIDAGEEFTVDIEAAYNFTDNLELVLGAQNVFDEYPDRNPWDFIVGSKYPTTAPSGINGGYYYAKVVYMF